MIVHTIWNKSEALCLHLACIKPEKLYNENKRWHSGSHAMAWAAIFTSVLVGFLRAFTQGCSTLQRHASCFYGHSLGVRETKTTYNYGILCSTFNVDFGYYFLCSIMLCLFPFSQRHHHLCHKGMEKIWTKHRWPIGLHIIGRKLSTNKNR